MMAKKRKQYSSQEKMTILRKHLLEGVPVSELCDKYDIQPSVFYRWQKLLFEQGQQVFDSGQRGAKQQQQRQIEALEKKLSKKDEVIAELMEEYVALKKSNGSV